MLEVLTLFKLPFLVHVIECPGKCMWNLNQSMGHTHMLFYFITLNLFLFYVYCLFYENVHALPPETGGELPGAGVTEGFHSQYRWDVGSQP